jgi:hypothetical protein
MGVHDYVNVGELPCPFCGEPVGGWQTKDSDCNLSLVGPEELYEFYTICEGCDSFVLYRRSVVEPPKVIPPPADAEKVAELGFRHVKNA